MSCLKHLWMTAIQVTHVLVHLVPPNRRHCLPVYTYNSILLLGHAAQTSSSSFPFLLLLLALILVLLLLLLSRPGEQDSNLVM